MSAGPYQSETDAHAAVPESWGQFDRFDALVDACLSAGVRLGDYDRRILWHLAGRDRGTAAVVADLITRAARSRDSA